jgi:hypothetical protein
MIQRSNNITTVTTITDHGLSPGQMVMLDGVQGDTAGRWNIIGQVLSTPTTTSFTLSDPGQDGFGGGGTITLITSPANDGVPGPFVFDPNAGVAITATATSSNQIVSGLRSISTLTVVTNGTVGFPESGYLVIGFGTQYEVGPIPYVAILDKETFVIDRTFVFPQTIPSGVNVSLLYQKMPWIPANVTEVGAFYVTDSSSGRVAAQAFIEAAAAAGVNVVNKIIYPGDRGIGGEGNPTTGLYLSDKVEVWAGDNVDQEVEAAHNG